MGIPTSVRAYQMLGDYPYSSSVGDLQITNYLRSIYVVNYGDS
jgi:hypothetical protein